MKPLFCYKCGACSNPCNMQSIVIRHTTFCLCSSCFNDLMEWMLNRYDTIKRNKKCSVHYKIVRIQGDESEPEN